MMEPPLALLPRQPLPPEHPTAAGPARSSGWLQRLHGECPELRFPVPLGRPSIARVWPPNCRSGPHRNRRRPARPGRGRPRSRCVRLPHNRAPLEVAVAESCDIHGLLSRAPLARRLDQALDLDRLAHSAGGARRRRLSTMPVMTSAGSRPSAPSPACAGRAFSTVAYSGRHLD